MSGVTTDNDDADPWDYSTEPEGFALPPSRRRLRSRPSCNAGSHSSI